MLVDKYFLIYFHRFKFLHCAPLYKLQSSDGTEGNNSDSDTTEVAKYNVKK
jgi:hypothetical protein